MTPLVTGIDELDTLLFGDELYLNGRERRISPGEVVLIRGEPGSGKTTLALQIASNVLRKVPEAAVLFLSIEESKSAIERKQAAYNFYRERFQCLERQAVHDLVRPRPPEAISAVERAAVQAGATAAARAAGAALHVDSSAAEPLVAAGLGALWTDLRGRLRRAARDRTPHPAPVALLIVDSLNAFVNLLLDAFPDQRPRLLFGWVCEDLRTRLADPHDGAAPVILVTGEYHFHAPDIDKLLPESFFCDAEIVLRTEPLRTPRSRPSGDNVTLGYDVTALVDEHATSLETRSFCRVLKSRFSFNQSRRCAYDIEPQRGLRFFETYPGDGKLMLFAENEQQRASWRSFFERDLPDAYPALRHEQFAMPSLQSVYESTRRLHNVPLKTDMFLCSLDSYWVIGYRDYRFKQVINERLLELIESNVVDGTNRPKVDPKTLMMWDEQQRSKGSNRACLEYPRLVNDLLYLTLLDLDLQLRKGTSAALSAVKNPSSEVQRRQARLAREIDLLGREILQFSNTTAAKHDDLCMFLFEKTGRAIYDSMLKRTLRLTDTFLRPLPRSKIALFGQYNGQLLGSLRREDMHEFIAGEDHWLSIPYDANVGIFVVRVDRFDEVLRNLDTDSARFTDPYKVLKRREIAVLRTLKQRLQRAQSHSDEQPATSDEQPATSDEQLATSDGLRDRIDAEIARCERQLQDPDAPLRELREGRLTRRLTWDHVICLSAAGGYPIGIETTSFDTLMSSFLEIVWNCGGAFKVNARYHVENKVEQLVPLALALHYFCAIFDLTSTPANQTIDPASYQATEGPAARPYGNWLFSRFWYSTLVDAVTAKREAADASNKSEFVWKNDDTGRVRLEIVQMPNGTGDPHSGHFTCWGEWNFALVAGSENVALACDLISNLMGALRVQERGLRGAALPTVVQFYDRFGGERCIPRDLREDLELPLMTFDELRTSYLEPAKGSRGTAQDDTSSPRRSRDHGIFRQAIFDYRHCGREVYSVLRAIKDGDGRGSSEEDRAARIVGGCMEIIHRIERLRDRYMFIGQSFRHDVLQLGRQSRERDGCRERAFQRFAVTADCTLGTAPGLRLSARLLEISQGGCRVKPDAPTQPSDLVAVWVTDTRIEVSRKRPRGDELGLEFSAPIARPEFEKLLVALDGSERRVAP